MSVGLPEGTTLPAGDVEGKEAESHGELVTLREQYIDARVKYSGILTRDTVNRGLALLSTWSERMGSKKEQDDVKTPEPKLPNKNSAADFYKTLTSGMSKAFGGVKQVGTEIHNFVTNKEGFDEVANARLAYETARKVEWEKKIEQFSNLSPKERSLKIADMLIKEQREFGDTEIDRVKGSSGFRYEKFRQSWNSPKARKIKMAISLGLLGATFVGAAMASSGGSLAAGGAVATKAAVMYRMITRPVSGFMATEGVFDTVEHKRGILKKIDEKEAGKMGLAELKEMMAARESAGMIEGVDYNLIYKDALLGRYTAALAETIRSIGESSDSEGGQLSLFEQVEYYRQLDEALVSRRNMRLGKYTASIIGAFALGKIATKAGGYAGEIIHDKVNPVLKHAYDTTKQYVHDNFHSDTALAAGGLAGAEPLGELVNSPENFGKHINWHSWKGGEVDVGKWIDGSHVSIDGHNYDVLKDASGKLFIETGVDVNHDGIIDASAGKAKVFLESGAGYYKDQVGFAWDKDVDLPAGHQGEGKFDLVFRTDQVMDVSGDGMAESSFYFDDHGVAHLNHEGINPAGVKIDGQDLASWQSDPTKLAELKANIFNHDIKFDHFVLHNGIDVNDHAAVAKDFAHQYALAQESSYDYDPATKSQIFNEVKMGSAENLWAKNFQTALDQNPKFAEYVTSHKGLTTKEWQTFLKDPHYLDQFKEAGTAPTKPTTPVEQTTPATGVEKPFDGVIEKIPSGYAPFVGDNNSAMDKLDNLNLNNLPINDQLKENLNDFHKTHERLIFYQDPRTSEFLISSPDKPAHGFFPLGSVVSKALLEALQGK